MINKTGVNLSGIKNSYSTQRADKVEISKAAASDTTKKTSASGISGKMDTIEISHRPAAKDSVVSDITNKIVDEMNTDTDPQIIKDLKEKYESGEYSADPNEIARMMLEDW